MNTKVRSENMKVRDHSEGLGLDEKISERMLGKRWEGVDRMHLAQDRDQWRAGSCEHGNEPSGSIKGGEFRE
jgi:hypothetical protein